VGVALYDPRHNRLRQVRRREGGREGGKEGWVHPYKERGIE